MKNKSEQATVSFSFFILYFLFSFFPASGEVMPIKYTQIYKSIPVEVLEDRKGELSFEDVKNPAMRIQFQDWENDNFNFKTHTYYWAKIELENLLPAEQNLESWVMKIPVFSQIEAYIELADGSFAKQKSGRFTSLYQKKFAPTFEGNFLCFQLLPQQKTTIFFRAISERAALTPSFDLTLQPLNLFYQNQQPIRHGNAVFIGLVSMMLIYNLISYFFGRHPSFLYYSGYLMALVFYDCFISGYLIDWVEIDFLLENPKYYYVLKLVIYPGLMCYMAFLCSVLDLKKLLPFWNRLYRLLIKLGFFLIPIDLLFTVLSNYSFAAADYVTVIYIFLFIVPSFVFIIPLYKSKSTLGLYILAGVVCMTAGFLISGLNRLFIVDFNLTPFRVGTVLEILFFSLGLAYRQRQNERAKQQARFELEKTEILKKQQEAEANRLAELDEFKNRFFTNITHEFRTPLTVIQGMTEQIDDKKYERETDLILQSNQDLLNLVNQMLDLTKLESGKLELHLVNGNITDFLQQIVADFNLIAKNSAIQILFKSTVSDLEMAFDKEKIKQILTNLLSNALKFTESGGKINLSIGEKMMEGEPFLTLKISDTGMGIAEVDLPHIFNRFYQVENNDNSLQCGTGIGLALTKELVNFMEGHISVESKLGEGTQFEILLPIVAITENVAIKKEIKSNKISKNRVPKKLNDNILAPTVKPLILLIEDHGSIIEYLKDCLQTNYKIITAANGKIGLKMAMEKLPSLIISDISMPEMDGFELTKLLKNTEKTNHIPIILLTARATQQSKIAGLRCGADAYLFKPFDREELLVRITQLLDSRKKMEQHYSIMQQLFPEIQSKESEEIEFLQTLNNLIEHQMDNEKLSVETLAKGMCMSRATLYRTVKKMTGKTTQNYLALVRLQHAKNLINTTNLSMSDICFQVGFSDLSHFSRKYSKQFGHSPSKEREYEMN